MVGWAMRRLTLERFSLGFVAFDTGPSFYPITPLRGSSNSACRPDAGAAGRRQRFPDAPPLGELTGWTSPGDCARYDNGRRSLMAVRNDSSPNRISCSRQDSLMV